MLNKILRTIKENILFVAIIVGAVLYEWISRAAGITPFILFLMLFLTFSKVSLKELKFTKVHLILLLFQIITSTACYLAIAPWNIIVAQGTMICLVCPTAISAAVVTSRLGGKVESITAYTIISNFSVAILIPFLFPLISENIANENFWTLFLGIIMKIFPLLICPFLLAQLIKYLTPTLNKRIANISGLSFYLWALALTIVTAQTTKELIAAESNTETLFWLAALSLITCAIQFCFGRYMGKYTGYPIAAAQSLGQKNTILAIWICHTYLNPLSALAPGCYVIWQNLFNAWQLRRMKRIR